jgi:hypothetical protein
MVRCDKANGENTAWPGVAQFVEALTWSSVLRRPQVVWSQENATPNRSDWPLWIPTEVAVGPWPAESATGPMEKNGRSVRGATCHENHKSYYYAMVYAFALS